MTAKRHLEGQNRSLEPTCQKRRKSWISAPGAATPVNQNHTAGQHMPDTFDFAVMGAGSGAARSRPAAGPPANVSGAAGAFPTAHRLMLSCAIESAEPGRHGITAAHHSPGVGQNQQEYPHVVFGQVAGSPNFDGLPSKALSRLFEFPWRRGRSGKP